MPKSKTAKGKSGGVRIIAGSWRGRRLPVHEAPGLRPTTDRVRETLFNWLAPDIRGARCLDLFAGSGALGLECISRGAASLQLVEANRSVASRLRDIAAELSKNQEIESNISIHVGDALAYLNSDLAEQFDVVFLDPPFDSDLSQQAANLLEANQCLAKTALIYIERHAKSSEIAVPSNWSLHRKGRAGESRYQLYRRTA